MNLITRFFGRSQVKLPLGRSGKQRPPEREYGAAKGHYMRLNLGLFQETDEYMCPEFQEAQSDGFTGVFLGRAPVGNTYDIFAYALSMSLR